MTEMPNFVYTKALKIIMNRIILIGNGFDLAHGLRTSYADFINYYWEYWGRRLQGSYLGNDLTDSLCSISQKGEQQLWYWLFPSMDWQQRKKISPKDAIEMAKNSPDVIAIKRSPFFEHIDKSVESKNWVDIENEFYLWLKKIFKKNNCEYDTPVPLNEELGLIKEKLIEYLKFIQEEQIKPELAKDCIRQIIYEPFDMNDISNNGQSVFHEFVMNRWNTAQKEDKDERRFVANKYGYSMANKEYELKEYIRQVSDLSGHWNNMQNGPYTIPNYFLLPDQILFLNFNYTFTANLYIPKGADFKINHIHGELCNDKNPIIFGYGDELDDDYKEISKLNDNDYLKNIKSIRYLETDNYRKLLSFIDSAPFQIYIMGHSCGNSDRTLLNTLFEHKNCVSIKPFYYERPDGTDNYIEIIQNISRNFNSMQLMRDRVVNKTYCRPLVPQEAK